MTASDPARPAIRYACLLDSETTGLSISDGAQCIEIAVMLYDLDHAQPVASYASLLRGGINPAEHVNHISPKMLMTAPDPDLVWRAVRWLIEPAQVIVAHRAEFDRQFVPDLGKPWVCTKTDIKWPGRIRGDHLVQLALALGLGVASAHRAMADVDTMARILTRVAEKGCDLGALMLHGLRPKLRYVAVVSYDDRQKAKDWGFLWDDKKRIWWRDMPPEDTEELPFPVRAGTNS